MGKIVYVLSDNRSGSTLLDQLLGAHGRIVSLGEVHHVRAYALQDRSLYDPIHPLACSCGMPIDRCPFWAKVRERLGRSLESLNLTLRFSKKFDGGSKTKRLYSRYLRRLVGWNPRLLNIPFASTVFDATRVGADSFALYNAVFDETGTDFLVDSSKNAFRFRALYDYKPEQVLGVMLGRDYRGTVYSKVKRGRDLRISAESWAKQMNRIRVLTDDVSPRCLIRVKYEDLCHDPRAEMIRVCNFLNIEFSDSMLARPSTGVHHLGGSPSKFDPSRRAIELDQSYLDAFTENDLAIMRDVVGDAAKDWGYI